MLPDTLTPEQAMKLGLIPKAPAGRAPSAMPDTLTPDEAKRLGLIGGEDPMLARIRESAAAGSIPGSTAVEASPTNRIPLKLSTLDRMVDTFRGGARAVGTSAAHPIETITDPARRRQFERGIDDMVTLGYGQRLAGRVGRALGDTAETDLQATELPDAQTAGDFRSAGNILGMFTPGAANLIGKGGAKLVAGATRGLAPTGILAGAGLGAVRGVAGYETTAPLTAALSAGSEGNRLEAARQAATDPTAIAIAGLGGATSEGLKTGVDNSKGAAARRFIEEKGQGAEVGVLSPGSGGVFDRELKGVPATDKGIGMAAKREAQALMQQIKAENIAETKAPYKRLKAEIDGSPAASTPRDVTDLVTTMQSAAYDLETAPFARSALNEQLAILERYRDANGAVMVPERQLNGLRRTLMRSAKVGTTDAPKEADAPLRAAAIKAKELVDQGPYAALNDLYASGARKLEGQRTSLGLKAKPPKDSAVDTRKLKLSLLREDANTQTGGGDSDLAAFRANNVTPPPLTALERARADLSFHLAPRHGGLMARAGGGLAPLALGYEAATHPLAALGGLALQNATPIAGRLLYPLAQRAPAAVGIGTAAAKLQAGDQDFAVKVKAGLAQGMSLEDAIAAARAE